MPSHVWKKVGLNCIVTLLGCGLAATASGQGDSADLARRQTDAYRAGGLRAAASIAGSYVGAAPSPNWDIAKSLKELIDASDLVLEGTVLSNVCALSDEGRSIVTKYEVRVDAILSATGPAPSAASVLLPGGRVSIGDGTWAQLNTPDFLKPVDGKKYVWFVRRARPSSDDAKPDGGDAKDLVPTSGPLGVYHIGPEVTQVHPNGNFRSDLAKAIRRAEMSPAEFVEEVRRLIGAKRH